MLSSDPNVFPPRLREVVEIDEYLVRVQRSLALKARQWKRRSMIDAAYVALTLRARIIELRTAYRVEVEEAVRDIPIVRSARGVSGLQIMAFLRLAILIDIEKADTPAALWRYCGVGVSGTIADTVYSTRAPGVVTFSAKAKRCLYDVRKSLMQVSPYRAVFAGYQAYQLGRGVRKVVAYRRAGRYAIKLWLKHLWLVWRRQSGLPVGEGHADDATRLAAPYGWL